MTGGEGQDLLIRVSLPISFGNITPLFSGSSLVLSSLSLYIYKSLRNQTTYFFFLLMECFL